MAHTEASGAMTGKPLIESDRVEGTDVYDPQGNNIGSIKRLVIEKISGKVAFAVMSFGGFLGLGEEEHTIPYDYWRTPSYWGVYDFLTATRVCDNIITNPPYNSAGCSRFREFGRSDLQDVGEQSVALSVVLI